MSSLISLKRISKILQLAISNIFQKKLHDFPLDAIVIVTEIDLSPSLEVADVYLSFIGTGNEAEVLKNIIANTKKIKRELGYCIRNKIRRIPNLQFHSDDTCKHAFRIKHLLDNNE